MHSYIRGINSGGSGRAGNHRDCDDHVPTCYHCQPGQISIGWQDLNWNPPMGERSTIGTCHKSDSWVHLNLY